jgi:predicted metal-binding membrane protein
LFVLLFPLGMLNIAALAVITALIFAEKSLAVGRQVSRVAAVALITYGALILVLPAALPTAM